MCCRKRDSERQDTEGQETERQETEQQRYRETDSKSEKERMAKMPRIRKAENTQFVAYLTQKISALEYKVGLEKN